MKKKQTKPTNTSKKKQAKPPDTSGIHWMASIKDITFDAEGRTVIKDPKLAKQIKKDIGIGRDILIMAANSGDFCVNIHPCFVRNP